MYSLPNYTSEKYRVTISRLIDEDPSKFDVVSIVKWFFIIADNGFLKGDPHDLPEREVAVMDFKGFTWWHLIKIASNLSTIKIILRYVQVTQ
jgi:hypothetical protein